jgi:hypothetical protein
MSAKGYYQGGRNRIFYRYVHDKKVSFEGEQCSSGKKSKEGAIMIVGCNADESEKHPLLVTRKSSIPAALKTKKLPVAYTANRKAWMTSSISPIGCWH